MYFRGILNLSNTTQVFYHSTLNLQQIYTVDCPSCKWTHNLNKREDSSVVLMTSSTLHNVFMNPDVRMRFHIDIKSWCGSTTLDLGKAWSRTYELDRGPTDIIISLGLNDVERKKPRAFMNPFHAWKDKGSLNNPTSTFPGCADSWGDPNWPDSSRMGRTWPPCMSTTSIRSTRLKPSSTASTFQNRHTHVPGFQLECRARGSIRNAEGVMTKHQMSAWRGELKSWALLEGGKVPGLEGTQGRQQKQQPQKQLALNG